MSRNILKVLLVLVVPYLASCAMFDADIQVPQMKKTVADTPDAKMCANFTMTKGDVATFFRTAKMVDKYTYQDAAIILPCGYEGTLSIDQKPFQWRISAGGSGYLYQGDTIVQRFLCTDQCGKALPALSQQ